VNNFDDELENVNEQLVGIGKKIKSIDTRYIKKKVSVLDTIA
jgi:hypothetical protein